MHEFSRKVPHAQSWADSDEQGTLCQSFRSLRLTVVLPMITFGFPKPREGEDRERSLAWPGKRTCFVHSHSISQGWVTRHTWPQGTRDTVLAVCSEWREWITATSQWSCQCAVGVLEDEISLIYGNSWCQAPGWDDNHMRRFEVSCYSCPSKNSLKVQCGNPT